MLRIVIDTSSGGEYREVGEKWSRMAHLIEGSSQKGNSNSEEAWNLLLKTADEEKRILKSLADSIHFLK